MQLSQHAITLSDICSNVSTNQIRFLFIVIFSASYDIHSFLSMAVLFYAFAIGRRVIICKNNTVKESN